MKKLLLLILLFVIVLIFPSCGRKAKYTTKVVKPKYHHRYYDRQKDRHTTRTKKIKVQN